MIKSAELSQCGIEWGKYHSSQRTVSITVIMGHKESCPGHPLRFVMSRKWTPTFTCKNKYSPWQGRRGDNHRSTVPEVARADLAQQGFDVVGSLCP